MHLDFKGDLLETGFYWFPGLRHARAFFLELFGQSLAEKAGFNSLC